MKQILSVKNMKNSDAACIAGGVPSKELMQKAAQGLFDAVKWEAPVAIICGKGNNAGDGFALALLLKKAEINCSIFLLSDKFSDDGKYYYHQCIAAGIEISEYTEGMQFNSFNTIVDCIFGTGFKGKPEGIFADAVKVINSSGKYIVSADINSGLNGDNGLCEVAVKSDLTVAVGGFKTGHYLNMAKDYIGKLVNADIGIKPIERTYNLADDEYVSGAFPARKNFSNKGDYGYIALVGGCEKYTGAVRLAGMASCSARAGAGVVQLAVIKSLANLVGSQILESTVYPLSEENGHILFKENEISELCERCKAIAFGMGIGLGEEQKKTLLYLLENFQGNLIIDADGITALAELLAKNFDVLKLAKCEVILTPHVKEFARLLNSGLKVGFENNSDINIDVPKLITTDDIISKPIQYAEEFALANSCVLLLKGPTTIITDGENTNLCNSGCAGLATAGSGDVLSGIIAASCGYNDNILLAATAAAYVNGKAGELAQEEYGAVSMVASDTAMQLAKVIKAISNSDKQ